MAIRIEFTPQILALYQADELTVQEIADLCDLSYSTAARELQRAGMTVRPTGRRRKSVVLSPDVLVKYQAGKLTVQEIADQCGASYPTVAGALRRAGIPSRPRGPRVLRLALSPEDVARFQAGTLTVNDLAMAYHVSSGAIARALHGAGVEVRSGRQGPPIKPRAHYLTQYADIIARFRQGQTLEQIAAQVGRSHERIRQILERAGICCHKWTPADQMTVASRLRERRAAAGLTPLELAKRSGLKVATITDLEQGRRRLWSPTLRMLAQALQIPFEELCPAEAP